MIPQSNEETPMELMRQALIQHFEDDKRFQDEFRAFVGEIRPYMQGAAGLGLLWKGIVAIGGLIFLWVQIKSMWGGH